MQLGRVGQTRRFWVQQRASFSVALSRGAVTRSALRIVQLLTGGKRCCVGGDWTDQLGRFRVRLRAVLLSQRRRRDASGRDRQGQSAADKRRTRMDAQRSSQYTLQYNPGVLFWSLLD